MNGDSKAIVGGFIEAVFVRHDLAAIDSYSDNADLKQAAVGFATAFPDIELTPEHLIAEGDLVAVRVTARATHLGELQGIPPTGRRWEATGSAWYQLRDGKIVDFWVNWDMLSILQQIGALPE